MQAINEAEEMKALLLRVLPFTCVSRRAPYLASATSSALVIGYNKSNPHTLFKRGLFGTFLTASFGSCALYNIPCGTVRGNHDMTKGWVAGIELVCETCAWMNSLDEAGWSVLTNRSLHKALVNVPE